MLLFDEMEELLFPAGLDLGEEVLEGHMGLSGPGTLLEAKLSHVLISSKI